MDEIKEFFRGLFSTSEWPARWVCGEWSSFHGWLYIISDICIWLAYFAIPFIIISFFYKKKTGLRYPQAYFLFAAFIFFCGATHYMDAMMFWFPMYRLNALIRFGTAVASVGTVFYLIKILPEAYKLKTSTELEKEVEKRMLAEARLEDANRNLASFAYVASHDLQEPLRKISTFSSILAENNQATYDTRSKELNDKISSSAQRLQIMISELLKLSSIKEDVRFERVNTTDVVKSAIEDLEIKIEEKQAEINIGDLPAVYGHQPYLKQLFVNLISNAIKFTKQKPVINITGQETGNMVEIYVQDNGIGMGENERSKIFQVFYRLHPKDKYEGYGIGLSLCKKIVDIHNGIIKVDSKEGEGTTFTIVLPAGNIL